MENDFKIFVVDDDPVVQTLLVSILKKQYEVEVFASSEECLVRLDECTPKMFLLDVALPGIDGYALCRRLRENDATREVPVTFISGHDSEEDRLTGYEAGGDDFVVKPFNIDELLRKVGVAQRLVEERQALRARASETEKMVFTMMSNIGESASLVQGLRSLVECARAECVADSLLDYLNCINLSGVVQVRVGERHCTVSPDGRDRPLEVSVIGHVRGMGRIFEFRKRAVFNFPHVSVMVNNMPLEDADLCGRIRDRLAIVVEVAESRLESIEVGESNLRKQEGIRAVLEGIRETIQTLNDSQQKARFDGTTVIYRMQENFARAFVNLGLTEQQESSIDRLVNESIGELVAIYENADRSQAMLNNLGTMLEKLSS